MWTDTACEAARDSLCRCWRFILSALYCPIYCFYVVGAGDVPVTRHDRFVAEVAVPILPTCIVLLHDPIALLRRRVGSTGPPLSHCETRDRAESAVRGGVGRLRTTFAQSRADGEGSYMLIGMLHGKI